MNRLRIARIDRHRLRAVGLVELVARSTFDFGHHDGADNAADADLSMFVRHIAAIARDRTARGIDIAAVSVCDLKLRPRHGLLRRGAAVFLDDQVAERSVEKLQMHCLAAFDLDVLRRLVQQEPSRGPDLARDDRHTRLQAIHKDLTRSVRCIDTVVVADKRAVTIS